MPVYDIIASVFGLHFKPVVLAFILGVSTALGLALEWLDLKVTLYIWERSTTYYIMLGALLLDTLTGSILAFRQNKFETRRAAIGLIKLVSYSIMLAMAFQLGKHERTFFWLPETVAFSLILLTVTSVAKNGSLLGILPPMLSRQLLRYVDNYKEQPIKTTPPAAPHA